MTHTIQKHEQYALVNIHESAFDDDMAAELETLARGLFREGFHNLILNFATATDIASAGISILKKINMLCSRELGLMAVSYTHLDVYKRQALLDQPPMIESLLFSLLLWIWDNRSFDTISRSNRAKIEGQQAYNEKDYQHALEAYQNVSTASLFAEPESRLNLAHTYFQLKQLRNAQKYYAKLSLVSNPFLASRALNQLGVIETMQKDTAQALLYFRQSLRINPDNDKAQYNLSLIHI